ncbi:MAG: DUF6232 family protein [Methylococcaceae bacterium]|jgi:hypothetical protein
MAEQTFLENRGVTVTSARFITGGQTFALNNITSVKQGIIDFDWKGPLILIVIGMFLLAGETVGTVASGILLAGGGVFWWIKGKADYLVILHTSAGEQTALKDTDKDFIAKVIGALNDAIASKG